MRTLIVRPGAIGDALLTFPLINMLRKQDAHPHVTLVSNPAVLPLVQAFGLAEAVYDYDQPQWSELFSPAGISSPTLRDLLRQTEHAICWLTDSDGIVQHNLQRAGIASVTVKPGRPPQEQQHLHQVVYLAETLGLPPIDVTAPFVPPTPLSPPPHPTGAIHCAPTLAETLGLPPPNITAPFMPPSPLSPPPHPTGAMNCAPTLAENVGAQFIAPVGVGRGNTIAIHPGSGGASKCWPIAHFTALIDKLLARGVPILLLAGPADHERLATILDALALRHSDQQGKEMEQDIRRGEGGYVEWGGPLWSPAVASSEKQPYWRKGAGDHKGPPSHSSPPLAPTDTNIAGYIQGTLLRTLVDAPLLDVAYQLQQCRCYIGNDAGLTHLSAMLGIPTIAIFGPTDPARWRPLGPNVTVVRAQPLELLTVDAVMGTIEIA